MAESEYATTAKLSVGTIWDFVQDMDNWAPYLMGYQSHEKQSETDSLWTLKGDAGALQRTIQFQVHITEWSGPERVAFTLKGLNEAMEGAGEFEMEPFEDASAVAIPEATVGFTAWLVTILLRFVHRRLFGGVERGAEADAGPGAGMSRMTFRLRVDPAGPMAPMINAMMKPAMQVAAENLANRIIAHLEAQRS